ncbi:MAG: dephospho-CoA kinase [Cellulosilyticaceae bacterium]
MKVIGIVGGIGAGKTTVVELIETIKKTFIISADNIGHKILLKGERAYLAVVSQFGEKILGEDGEIIRRELGKIVFSSPDALNVLNAITHPIIYDEVKKQVEKCKEEGDWEIVVVDAALLVEIGLTKLVDNVIGVYADKEIRIKRIMLREGFTKKEAMARINVQKKWEELEVICDEIINNSDTLENTKEQLMKNINNW